MYFCIMVIVNDVSLICLSQKKVYLFKRSFKVQFICFLTLNNDNDKKKISGYEMYLNTFA